MVLMLSILVNNQFSFVYLMVIMLLISCISIQHGCIYKEVICRSFYKFVIYKSCYDLVICFKDKSDFF